MTTTGWDSLHALALAGLLAWASGLRLYLVVFMLGLAAHFQYIELPAGLHVLAHPYVIGAAGFMLVVEFFADKIPGLDTVWDAVHTFIRIPAGAVLAAGSLGHADPALLTVAALAGGTLAGASHFAKAGTRALINLSPEPVSNWAASTTEDVGALAGITLALFVPFLFLVLLLAFLVLAGWALPRLARGVHGGVSRMAKHMLPSSDHMNRLRSKHD